MLNGSVQQEGYTAASKNLYFLQAPSVFIKYALHLLTQDPFKHFYVYQNFSYPICITIVIFTSHNEFCFPI